MSKFGTMSLQIHTRKRDADQACSIFINAGYNYHDIEVKDYSTVKVKIVDPEKVKEEGGFWECGKNHRTTNFQVGDTGYIAITDTQIPEIEKWGLVIIKEIETCKTQSDEIILESLTYEKYSNIKERKELLERVIETTTIWEKFDPPLKSKEEIESSKNLWRAEVRFINQIIEKCKNQMIDLILLDKENEE